MVQVEEIVDSDGENAYNDSGAPASSVQELPASPAAAAAGPFRPRPREDGNQEKVAQFMSVTSSNTDEARRWLTMANWNVDQAVNLFFDDSSKSSSRSARPPPNQSLTGELSALFQGIDMQDPEVQRELRNMGLTPGQDIGDLALAFKKSRFLQKVQPEARQAARSQPRYDARFGGEVDVLAGVTFLWSNPPRALHVQAGSAGEGVVDVGETLRTVDGVDVRHLSRNDILHRLANAHQMGMRKERPSHSRFDKVSGVEISRLGSVEVKWTDLPVVLSDSQQDSEGNLAAAGDIVTGIGGVCLQGKTKEEICRLYAQSDSMQLEGGARLQSSYALHQMFVAKLKHNKGIAVHPLVECTNCRTKPLVGTRYHCKVCQPSCDLCGTCYAGRGHSHPSNHNFQLFQFADSGPQEAPPPLQLNPGALVVVCGSGGSADGAVGEATALLWNGRWNVQLQQGGGMEAVSPNHLFLRSGGVRGVQPRPPPQHIGGVAGVEPRPSPQDEGRPAVLPTAETNFAHFAGACSTEGYDTRSGIPISLMGRLIIKWCQLPVILSDLTESQSGLSVIRKVGGEFVWGKSRQEVEALNNRSGVVGPSDLGRIVEVWHRGPLARNLLRNKLREDQLRVHCDAQCAGCSTFPLIGWRYWCKKCPEGYSLCGTCYSARAHSHPANHSFVKLEFALDQEQAAEPGLAIGPGAQAVVCGTGNAAWDGSEVVLVAFQSNAWNVTLRRDPSMITGVDASKLFLLSGSANGPGPSLPGIVRGDSQSSAYWSAPGTPLAQAGSSSPSHGRAPVDSSMSRWPAPREVFRCDETGLEVSSLKTLKVIWRQLPIVLDDPQEIHKGRVICAVVVGEKDVLLWGRSREAAEELCDTEEAKLGRPPRLAVRALPKTKEEYVANKEKLLKLGVRCHPEVKCEGCQQEPLLGQRFRCSSCSVNFCGACYPGRAHAHTSSHLFVVCDFPDSAEENAPPPLVLGPGAQAVVCGMSAFYEEGKIAGQVVTVKKHEEDGSWQVQQGSRTFSVEPQCLFLLAGANEVEAQEEGDNPDEKVAMLESLTGWGEAKVVSLLEKHGWNVGKAKQDFELLQKAETPGGAAAAAEPAAPKRSEKAEPPDGGAAAAEPAAAPKRWEDQVLRFHVIPRDQVGLAAKPPKELLLGTGSYGKVYRAKYLHEVVAAKVINLGIADSDETKEKMRKSVEREAAKMKDFLHPNILGFKGIVIEEDEVIILTEFCERGSLREVLKKGGPMEERLAISTICQVAKAMEYLHRDDRPIAHRDLKSLNILVKPDDTLKVCDFGLTEFTKSILTQSATSSRLNAGVGSTRWMAPEIGRKFKGCWLKCDVFSFACVIFEVLTGKLPWDSPEISVTDILKAVAKGERPEDDEPVPECALAKLMRACWQQEPQERPGFPEIVKKLVELEVALPRAPF